MRCPLLENECSLEDLATANEKALHCARAWPNIIMTKFGDDGHERRIHQYSEKSQLTELSTCSRIRDALAIDHIPLGFDMADCGNGQGMHM